MTSVKGIIDNETIIIKMEQDESPESPREWDNLGKMVCWHSRYQLGDNHSYGEPREFLEHLANEAIHSEQGQRLIQEKADKEFGGYQIATNEEGEFLLIPQQIFDEKKTSSEFEGELFETKEEALERLEEAKEAWMEDEPETLFTFEELHQLIEPDYIILPLYLYDHSGITMNTTGFSCSWDSGQVGFIYTSKERFKTETGYLESELFQADKHRIPVVGEGVKIKGFEDNSYDGFGKVIRIEDNQVTVDFDHYKIPDARKEENIITVSLEDITEVRSERAKEMLEGEVETYDQYLRGDVYGFVVEKVTSCECCGTEETEEIDACWGFFGDNPFENGISDHLEKKYHELLKKLA